MHTVYYFMVLSANVRWTLYVFLTIQRFWQPRASVNTLYYMLHVLDEFNPGKPVLAVGNMCLAIILHKLP